MLVCLLENLFTIVFIRESVYIGVSSACDPESSFPL